MPGRASLAHVFIARCRPRRGVFAAREVVRFRAIAQAVVVLRLTTAWLALLHRAAKSKDAGAARHIGKLRLIFFAGSASLLGCCGLPASLLPVARGIAGRRRERRCHPSARLAATRAPLAPVLRIATMPLTAPPSMCSFDYSSSVMESSCATCDVRVGFGSSVSDVEIPCPLWQCRIRNSSVGSDELWFARFVF